MVNHHRKTQTRSKKIDTPESPTIKLAFLEIKVINGLYGVLWFLIFVVFFALFTKMNHLAIVGISVVLMLPIASFTYGIARGWYYRLLRNKIPLIKTIKNTLLDKLPGEEAKIEEAVRILEENYANPPYVPSFLRPKLEEIGNTLSNAFYLQNGGWFRTLNINYLDFVFRNTNIWNYLAANLKSSPIDIVCDALKNILEFQQRAESALHISIRDIYSGISDLYREKDGNAVCNYYDELVEEKRVKLRDHLRETDQEEYRKWVESPHKKPLLHYDFAISEKMTIRDNAMTMEAARSMKHCAKELATHIVTSETHIVLSTFLKVESGIDLMMISATNTNKFNLLVFSQTPLIWKDGDKWLYLCDESHYPSSETFTHWRLHQDLKAKGRKEYKCIVHCHSVDVLDYVKPKDQETRDIDCSIGKIRTLGWAKIGTEAFGNYIFFGMDESSVPACVIEDHGIWVAGASFEEATDLIVRIVNFTNKELEILKGSK